VRALRVFRGGRFATDDKDGRVRVLGLSTRAHDARAAAGQGHRRRIQHVDRTLAAGGGEKTVEARQPLVTPKGGGSIDSVASGPRRMLATAGQGGVALWDLHRPRTPVRKLCTQGLRWASHSRADGAKLATAGADGTVGLWDLIHRLVSFADHYRGQVNAVAFSADGHTLASVGSAGPGRGGGRAPAR
jgi:WD40 repeat protein